MKLLVIVVFGSVLVLGFWVGLKIAFWWHKREERRKSRLGNRHGQEGEEICQKWLVQNGFRILSAQDRKPLYWSVDGDIHHYVANPDFIAENGDGELCLVECKTGHAARVNNNSDVRRQILEYALAYPEVKRYFLFDADQQNLHHIEFGVLVKDSEAYSIDQTHFKKAKQTRFSWWRLFLSGSLSVLVLLLILSLFKSLYPLGF